MLISWGWCSASFWATPIRHELHLLVLEQTLLCSQSKGCVCLEAVGSDAKPPRCFWHEPIYPTSSMKLINWETLWNPHFNLPTTLLLNFTWNCKQKHEETIGPDNSDSVLELLVQSIERTQQNLYCAWMLRIWNLSVIGLDAGVWSQANS